MLKKNILRLLINYHTWVSSGAVPIVNKPMAIDILLAELARPTQTESSPELIPDIHSVPHTSYSVPQPISTDSPTSQSDLQTPVPQEQGLPSSFEGNRHISDSVLLPRCHCPEEDHHY